MKKLLCALALIVGFVPGMLAQVDNYSLRLTPEGSVNVYQFPELNDLSTYTIQFWINVDTWEENALIYNRGGDFSASLGAAGTINFKSGSTTLPATSTGLAARTWAQVTMIAGEDGARVLINGEEAGSTATAMTIPTSEADLVIGGGINGRLDEFRIWKAELSGEAHDSGYQYFIYNTLNKYAPQWSDLVAYYKFDQNLCDNVVDYTFTNHNGSFSAEGANREVVTDNDKFKYYYVGAYCDFSRFFDRGETVTRDKYLLANDIIVIGIESYSDGHLKLMYPYSEGELVNAEYMPEWEGRTGVLSLDGTGQGMNVGKETMNPTDKWTFHTWIYIEKWTPGAYILKKESADNLNGVSIRLGETPGEAGQLIVRCNGQDFPMATNTATAISTGKWCHIGVYANVQNANQLERTFTFVVDGNQAFGVKGSCGSELVSYTPSGVDNVDAIIGENLKAKLDETAIWDDSFSRNEIYSYGTGGCPLPALGRSVTAQTMFSANGYWKYDDAENPGYDYFSSKYYLGIMRSAYEGYRGYKIRVSVKGHDGWQTTISNAEKRRIFAADLAEISKELDGVELDLEWCNDVSCWNNYGLLLDEIKDVLPADKVFAISPHRVSYGLPTQYMDNCDFYTFQIYGPQKVNFTMSAYESSYNSFITQGYPAEKIVMSYATTTSKGWKGNTEQNAAPIGVINGLLDGDYTPDKNEAVDASGLTRYFTGFNQTYDRTKFAREKGLKGIFYWDMGNDVPMEHKYNLTVASSYALNSNVDTVVTHVNVYPAGVELVERDAKADNNTSINIYPNPSHNGIVTMAVPAGETAYRVSVYDAQGVCKIQRETSETTLSVDELEAGVYFVSVLTRHGNTYTGRLIKK